MGRIRVQPQDEVWKNRLVKQLSMLEREGVLDVWEDRRIEAGADWSAEINAALKRAKVAVLLVSADFLNSQFIREKEELDKKTWKFVRRIRQPGFGGGVVTKIIRLGECGSIRHKIDILM